MISLYEFIASYTTWARNIYGLIDVSFLRFTCLFWHRHQGQY